MQFSPRLFSAFRSTKPNASRSSRGANESRRARQPIGGAVEALEPRLVLDSTVVFNELMYHATNDDPGLEWVELHNQMSVNMDLTGWQIRGGIDYDFPANTVIPAGGYLVVASTPANVPGSIGPFTGRLDNSGESLRLRNNSDRLMDELDYSDSGNWPVAPDGSGVSLAKRDNNQSSGPAANWSYSVQMGGTPGAENFPPFNNAPVDTTLIPPLDSWKYDDSGADLGTAWSDPNYDDSGWDSGDALFYDDPPAPGGAPTPAGAPSSPSLVSYWTFDDTTDDVFGPNDGGVLNGGATYSTQRPTQITTGKSLQLNGTTSYASIVPQGRLNGSYTVSMWARTATNNASTMFATRGPTDFGFDMKFRNGGTAAAQLHGDIGIGTSWASTAADGLFSYALNTWYHVAYVVRGNAYRIYVNGVQRAAANFTLTNPLLWDANHVINIGRHNSGAGGEYFNGFIDDVAVWSNALGASQIAALANGTSPLSVGPGHDGALRYIPITNDADSQISADKTYSHKLDFGNGAAAVVNGVTFDTNFVSGTGSTTIPQTFASDGSHNTSGAVASLFDDFIYNNADATITLSGLTVGQAYDLRLYIRQWGSVFDRSQWLEFDTDNDGGADRTVRLNPDDATSAAPDFAASNQAYAVSYVYVAKSTSAVVRIMQTGAGTYHLYGLTNEVTDLQPINSLYSTGLNAAGGRLVQGLADPHYTLLPGAAQGTTAVGVTNHSAWAPNDAGSGFIGVADPGTTTVAGGAYNYQTAFDLSGFDPASAELTMTLWCDNTVSDILLNGVSFGLSFAGFNHADGRTFKVTSGFVAGLNTLEFRTTNDGAGPGAFRADLSAVARPANTRPLGTAIITADNHYAVYVGAADGTNLRLVGRDGFTDWTTPETYGFAAASGEHVFVVAWDNPPAAPGQQMWIGRFVGPEGDVIQSTSSAWQFIEGPAGAHPGDTLLTSSLPSIAALQSQIASGAFAPVGAAAANSTAPWGTNAAIVSNFGGTPAQFLWTDTFANVSSTDTNNTYAIFRSVDPVVPIVKHTPLAEGLTTYYLRNEFQFNDDPARTVLSLIPTVDDGAVFYLNGVEIYRQNMPGGAVTNATPASGEVPGEPMPHSPIIVSAAALVPGRNVLSVELHRAAGSDDVQFGAELIASVTPIDPSTLPAVVINELPAATDADFFVELANNGSTPINLGGIVVSRLSPTPAETTLAGGTLAPGERLLLTEAQLGFDAADGNRIVVYSTGKSAVLDARAVTNRHRGRSADHDGRWLYPDSPTPGAANAFSFHDEIVINEIMYHHRATPAQQLVVENSQLVEIQSTWNYDQSGADLGTAWRESGFIPSGWGSGKGILYAGPFGGQSNPSPIAIPSLYSTGLDNNRVPLPNEGQIDSHYTLISAPAGAFDGPEAFIAEADGFPIGPWLANDAQSKWISARATPAVNDDAVVPVGTYVYRTTFDLTGFIPSSAVLSMTLGADNAVTDVLINGQSTGINYVGFNVLSGLFTLNSGFVAGVNTLDFVTENYPSGDNPAGFRAVLSGTALPIPKNTELALGPTTYYFRNQFTFDGNPAKTQLKLQPLNDDGAVYYLNGVEIYRQNMPAGAVGSATLASSNVPGQAGLGQPVTISAASLVNGVNTLAVEVHQAATGFDDMSFAAELFATETIQEQRDFDESPEEWIELYNKSNHSVDLTGWKLAGGIGYDFPAGTTMAPDSYLVIADNAAYLAGLHPSITILGNYSGQLSGGSDLIVLEDAAENPADEVRYYDSGKWHNAADGGGSSLELRDPDADNSNAAAWAASDETARSSWETITYRGVASNSPGSNPTQWNEFVFGLLDSGEFLIDDISVREDPDGANTQLIQNGSFTTDAATWRFLGTHGSHGRTVVEPDPTNPANNVLHVVATGATEHMHNHVETTYAASQTVEDGKTYEISFRAKWLSGSNQLNSRLYFNRLARTTLLDVPEISGTPGAPNSRLAANAAHNIGPTYENFRHTPVAPAVNQPVTVSASAGDPDGVASMTLWWRTDGGAWTNVAMTQSAAGNYSAQIPGQAAATLVQFYVEGQDTLGAASTYPEGGQNSRALYRVADGQSQPGGSHDFRILMLSADATFLHTSTNVMSNHRMGSTVVYDDTTVYYDTGVRLQGSERGRDTSNRVSFDVAFQPDQLFRGVHPTVSIDRSGGWSGRGGPQDEIVFWQALNRAGNIPAMYNDLVRVIAPQSQHNGSAMLLLAEYEDEYLDNQFEDGSDGELYKYELIYYPTTTQGGTPQGLKLPQPDGVNGVPLRSMGDNEESYRWNFLLRNNGDADDFNPVIGFLKTMDQTGASFLQQAEQKLDVDEWLRSIAAGILGNVGDSWVTGGLGHNAYFYKRPEDGRFLYFPWDNDFAWVGNTTDGFAGDRNGDLAKLLSGSPKNTHMYYGHLQDIVNTAFNATYITPWTTHLGSVAGQNYSGIASFVSGRASAALAAVNSAVPNVAFAITTNGGADFTTPDVVATLAGNGWVNVREIRLAGHSESLTLNWTTPSAWQASVPLAFGANALALEAYDFQGNLITTDTINITSTTSERPIVDYLRATELMYHPGDPSLAEIAAGYNDADDFEFIELRNLSSTKTLDLTGVRFTAGIEFDFTGGSVTSLAPGEYVLVVENTGAMAERYGAGLPIAGQYIGRLNNAGEQIRIQDANNAVVHDFAYDDDDLAGWHTVTDGAGPSLVIIDPTGNIANWGNGAKWRPSFQNGGSPGERDSLTGDLDANDRVDLADAAILQGHLGTPSGAARDEGDLNRDGAVNRADAAILARNYGRSYAAPGASPAAAAAAVVRNANRPTVTEVTATAEVVLRARPMRHRARDAALQSIVDDPDQPASDVTTSLRIRRARRT